ncbi:MAG: DJ-1/PfpI family protein [Halobacteriaceae archaeon]
METAEILCYDGMDELDAVGPHEVLANAADRGGPAPTLRTVEAAERVTSRQGLRIDPDGTLSARPDLLVVPGGGWGARDDVGAWGEAERGTLPAAIAARHDRGSTVAAVCTGAMLLAYGGLLDGRPAATHRGARDDLRERGADVREARVVDDGDVLTAGGVTAGLDLALRVVERVCGADVAAEVAANMEYERRGPVLTP